MQKFEQFTLDTAPQDSRPLLENSMKSFGMIPNLHAVMAASPPVLKAYQTLHELAQQTAFTPEELCVVWLEISVEHECNYCVPAHTAIAAMMDVSAKIVHAIREMKPLPKAKLEVLRQFTLDVLRQRGRVSDKCIQEFLSAGYEQRHILDIVLILSQKIMSNYINHMANTPLDEAFEEYAWGK
ncbi:carboxymuconolactone decarboxylase family protein [Algicola sagamiensis]|uniref:carboxymuconolactone decarboxylase family protein n=1 Tax=Algicola sagamiensis TaxID=163869 RepID=UPI0003653562|nr:carboxymuconolactone decarboxylase family protein [Algicola sagamiensis]